MGSIESGTLRLEPTRREGFEHVFEKSINDKNRWPFEILLASDGDLCKMRKQTIVFLSVCPADGSMRRCPKRLLKPTSDQWSVSFPHSLVAGCRASRYHWDINSSIKRGLETRKVLQSVIMEFWVTLFVFYCT